MQWNVGGWFGAQLGATVWILVAGGLSLVRDFPTGMVLLLLFAVANGVGTLLWWWRKLSCYASTQLLIATSGVCGLVAVFVLDRGQVWNQIQAGRPASVESTYGVIALVFAFLMLVFYWRFGRDGSAE